MTATSALPADNCRLDGLCGFCVTLTPAARAALAETLTADASATRLVDQPGRPEYLLRRVDAVGERASKPESATEVLAYVQGHGAWREAYRDFLAIESAKTIGLVVAAPTGVCRRDGSARRLTAKVVQSRENVR